MPLGYEVVLYEKDPRGGGAMRSQIPASLPESVLDEEVDRIPTRRRVPLRHAGREHGLAAQAGLRCRVRGLGRAAWAGPRHPGPREAAANIHIGIDWLASVAFEHTDKIGKRVVVLGGGNTAMDCCRTALRLGGEQVTVTVRSGFDEMKASPWEKEDAMHEGIPILDYHAPKSFEHENGR